MQKKISGFTLIELLVVIVIIGLLSAISMATFKSYFKKARDAERQASVQTMASMVKIDGAGQWAEEKYVYDVAGLKHLFKSNDYRPPKGKNNICYIFGSAKGESSYIGDDNDFVFMTWGEETSSWDAGTEGVIMDGTDQALDNVYMADLDVNDFKCDKSTVLAEMAFETGLLGDPPLYYLGINEKGEVFQWGDALVESEGAVEPPALTNPEPPTPIEPGPSPEPEPPAPVEPGPPAPPAPVEPAPEGEPEPPAPPSVQCSSFGFFQCIINFADCRWNWWFGPCENL